MSRVWQVWFAIGALLTAPALAMADGPMPFTTLPRPPMTAYEQPPIEELPVRPSNGSPAASNGIFNPTQLPLQPPPSPYAPGTSPAPTNGGGAALGSPYIGGPPPTSPYIGGPPPGSPYNSGPPGEAPAVLQPDFDAPYRNRWLSIDLPTAWLIFPIFSQHLSAPVQVGNLYTTTATLPTAPLDFTSSPGLSIRADLPNMGIVELGYRFIASEGSGYVLGVDPMGAAYMRSRLDVQIAELTYARHDFQTHGGLWDLLLDQDLRINDLQGPPSWICSWDIGARVASLYFDSHAVGATTDRQIVNYFVGGGAKVGVTLTRPIPSCNMNVFTRAELGAMMGGVRQQFSETAFDLNGNPLGFGYTARQQVQTVPTLAAQLGLSAFGPHHLGEWQAGYQFEQWWAIGSLVGSSGDLLTHSIFVRWMRNY